MRILHVLRTLNPIWGGPVEGVRNITTQAMARGYTPEILCIDHPSSSWLQAWKPKINAVGPSFVQYGFSSKLDQWLESNLAGYNVVIVHSIWMYHSYAVWRATRKIRAPYFVFIHGALDPWFKKRYPLKQLKKVAYWKAFEHKVLRDAEGVLFTSREEMLLSDRAFLPYECKPQVTGYGIAKPPISDTFDRKLAIDRITASHPALQKREFILLLARIHDQKGIDLLLRAFAATKHLVPDTALIIAGSSEGNSTLMNKLAALTLMLGISGDVIWTGPVYSAAKWELLQAASVYILPSHQENFGISVVESLACGTPVLISDKVRIWREIVSAKAGLVAPDTVNGAIQLLNDWSSLSPECKLQMRLNARVCFANHFDISVNCSKLFSTLSAAATTTALSELH